VRIAGFVGAAENPVVTSIHKGGPVVFAMLDHSGPSLSNSVAVVRALWFLLLAALLVALLAAG